MEHLISLVVSRMNYVTFIVLMVLGMYGIFIKKNYLKKIIGMNILQTAIILFFISIGAKRDATIPIIEHHGHNGSYGPAAAIHYINPLPHVLMLTAIVVAVATLGVALAMIIKIYNEFSSIEEGNVLSQITGNPNPGAGTVQDKG